GRFKVYFNSYADIFSNTCKDSVVEFKKYLIPSSEKISTTYYMDGHQESTYRDTYEEVYIDKRFTPQWAEFRPAVFRFFFSKAMKDMTSNEKKVIDMNAKEFAEKVSETLEENEAFQLGKFFKDHACAGATLTQLGENLIRAANDRPSMQEEGVALPGAEKESDPPSGRVPSKYLPPPKPEKIISREIAREVKGTLEAPPMDTAGWEKLISVQNQRAQMIDSKLSGGVLANTFNTRLKEDKYQAKFDAILKMAEKPLSSGSEGPGQIAAPQVPSGSQGRRGSRATGGNQGQQTAAVRSKTASIQRMSGNPKTVLIREMTEEYRKLIEEIKGDYVPKIQTTRDNKERQALQADVQRIQQKYSQKFQREIMRLQQGL
ncbi:MAG: hypothetical protein JNN05_09010, partial [Candidatus Omnitrophica bacterium]|nr:hypothetical protein [Candidatus Omnitrophota bacterium]